MSEPQPTPHIGKLLYLDILQVPWGVVLRVTIDYTVYRE